jgi:hypothetical protein
MVFPSYFLGADAHDVIFKLVASGLEVYVKKNGVPDPDNPSTYDFVSAGGFRLSDHVNVPDWIGTIFYIAIKNRGTATENFEIQETFLYKNTTTGTYPGDAPVFYRTSTDGTPDVQGYSYTGPFNSTDYPPSPFQHQLRVPRKGHCIYRLDLARKYGSISTSELVVKIGTMVGTTLEIPGVFRKIEEFTIPAGSVGISKDVFWPSLGGATLAYQCDEEVEIMPFVNFQPWSCSKYGDESVTGAWTEFSENAYISGMFGGEGNKNGHNTGFLSFFSDFTYQLNLPEIGTKLTFPVCKEIYNDLESVLNLL